ncbi:MAG: SprT-like domain-containing protein [Gemmatimonadaceae bacterium]
MAPATSKASATHFLDTLRALGLRGIHQLTLTNNRSTVVSFHGERLRVHQALVPAPLAMHQAIVNFVSGRGATRQAARRLLLSFELPKSTNPRPPRPRRGIGLHPDDHPSTERLRQAHRQLNSERFGGTLADVDIRVSRRMRSRLGHFAPGVPTGVPEIAISRRHIRRDSWSSVLETLVHEMVHQWQYETGRPLAHDARFRQKARSVGITPAARRRAGRVD